MNPYTGEQQLEGHAFVIRKTQPNKPLLYFVKDIRYQPPHEYWSPVQSMAKRFTNAFLAVDFARFLDSKPNAEQGETTVVPIPHRETVLPKPQVTPPAVQNKPVIEEAKWYEYSGVKGNAKPQPVSSQVKSAEQEAIDFIQRFREQELKVKPTRPFHSYRSESTQEKRKP